MEEGFEEHPSRIGRDPLKLSPTAEIVAATYTLFYDEEFAGTAIAVGPRLVISAGHNFKVKQYDVGKLRLVSAKWPRNRKPASVAYAQKDSGRDLLLLWPEEDLAFVSMRAFHPVPGTRVATVYASPKAPHRELVVSPGIVYTTTPRLCSCRGTVTTNGASGAPVVDGFGDRIVGIHLSVSDSAPDGSWVCEFVPARAVIDLLIEAHVDPHIPYRVEDEQKKLAEATKAVASPAVQPPRAKDKASPPKRRLSSPVHTATPKAGVAKKTTAKLTKGKKTVQPKKKRANAAVTTKKK